MSINDPLGDMLARIRNAQMRYKAKVTTPASKLREHVLDVLAEEGYIRGYARVDYSGGRSEFEIELKYFDGEPVIKDIKRVSTPGRRVYSSVKDLPTVANGLGVAILSTPKGVMSDSRARTENVGGEILCNVFYVRAMSRIRKKHVSVPGGVTAAVNGQEVKVKGPKGELKQVLVDDIIAKLDKGGIEIAMREDTKEARTMWGMSRTLVANLIAGVTQGFTKRLEI